MPLMKFDSATDAGAFLLWERETAHQPCPLAAWSQLHELIARYPDVFRGWTIGDWRKLDADWMAEDSFETNLFGLAVQITREKAGG